MSSTSPQPDPLSSLLQSMKNRVRTARSEEALAEKVRTGTATPEEIERFEQRPVKRITLDGMVEYTGAPEMSVDQWKAAIERDAERARTPPPLDPSPPSSGR